MKTWRIALLGGLAIVISGCASYSNMMNSFAPPKQKNIYVADAKPVERADGKSPFCIEPPPPPPPRVSEVYMVMPEEGGKAGTVAVTFNDGKETVLHGDYSAMSLAGDQKQAFVGDQAQLEKTFGSALAAMPLAPNSVTLYFLLGKDELTPESKAEAEKIYQDFVDRKVPEIWIIGHTDTVGTDAQNINLSIRRAQKVRDSLTQRGIPAENIKIEGRGERELLVNTPDNTKEPKNRRVEISVR